MFGGILLGSHPTLGSCLLGEFFFFKVYLRERVSEREHKLGEGQVWAW